MIRAIPSNASDNVYCTLLAQSAVHGAMAGYTGFTVGPVNGRHAYIPFNVCSSMFLIKSLKLIFRSLWFYFCILTTRNSPKLATEICYFLILLGTLTYSYLYNLFVTKQFNCSCMQRINERQNQVVITDRMWARVLSSTNQPSFLSANELAKFKREKPSCPVVG